MAIITTVLQYGTLAQVVNNGIAQLANTTIQMQNAIPGTMTGGWFAAIDTNGSWLQFGWDRVDGNQQVVKIFAKEVLEDARIPPSMVLGPPVNAVANQYLLFRAGGGPTAAEVQQMIALALGNMAAALSAGTAIVSAAQTMIVPGRTKPWNASGMVRVSGQWTWSGITVTVYDGNEAPPLTGLAASANQFFAPGGTTVFLPGQESQALLPDIDLAINNGTAIYSIMSNAITEP
jgi:hypothetical protein